MERQLGKLKLLLDNLKFKYPDNNISFIDEDNGTNIKIDEIEVFIENSVLKEGYDSHGDKFINSIIDMIEENMI